MRDTPVETHDAATRGLLRLRAWWHRREPILLGLAIGVLGAFALFKLGSEFYRLTLSRGFEGAIDLRMRYHEVHSWFAGRPLYTELRRLIYPPQAYALLWPFLGWLELGQARWLWAVTTVLVLAGLASILLRASGARTRRERAFVILMLLSMNAVGVTVGNGQLVLHLLLALLGGLLLLRRASPEWWTDLAAAFLLAAALAKPTLAAPFAWVAILAARRMRPLLLTGAAYLGLTLLAAAFQTASATSLLRQWWALARPRIGAGYGDLPTALVALGLADFAIPAGLVLLAALGVWIYQRRHADFWILLGVTALVARFWTYHRVYDDALILIPMAALFRIAKNHRGDDAADVKAGLLLTAAVLAMLAPARMQAAAPPLNWLFIGGHVLIWLAMLWFLMRMARLARPDVLVPFKSMHPHRFHTE